MEWYNKFKKIAIKMYFVAILYGVWIAIEMLINLENMRSLHFMGNGTPLIILAIFVGPLSICALKDMPGEIKKTTFFQNLRS